MKRYHQIMNMYAQSRSKATIEKVRKCFRPYMVTISCQQKKDYIDKQMLDEVILWLKISIPHLHIIRSVYENSGKYRQLHWHAIVTTNRVFRYAPYTAFGLENITRNTYRIQWEEVYNSHRAVEYLAKDLRHQSQDDILTNNYYSINRFNELYLD